MFHFMFVFFILLVQFGLLSGHLLENSCPLGKQFVLIVFCLFVIFIFSHFGFKSGICLLIVLVPVHCFSFTFTYFKKVSGVCALSRFRGHTCCNQKNQSQFDFQMTLVFFLIIVKSFREVCIFDCNVKYFTIRPI